MKPRYLAYYTPAYEKEAEELVWSMEEVGIGFGNRRVVPWQNYGSWQKNTQAKARFVVSQMADVDSPIVYVDADARFRQYPQLFDVLAQTDCDFAAHWRQGEELLSGTLYFGPGPNGTRLACEWATTCEQYPEMWDQQCLQIAVKAMPELKIERLPFSYCRIFDGEHADERGVAPVIEHMQASRRLRQVVEAGR